MMPDDEARSAMAVLALDIGGTAIKAAILDEGGVIQEDSWPTNAAAGPAASQEAVQQAVARLLERLPASHRVAGIGLVVPGTVDEKAGRVIAAKNLGWSDVPIARIVEQRYGLPVAFGHDVRTAGLAEWKLGAGRGADDLAYLSIGTGIAAAIVLNGELVVSQGYAGEVGHGGRTDGERCACGGLGCAETVASAAAIARRYARLSGRVVPGAKEVLDAAAAGDDAAIQVWREAIERLGELVSEVVRTTGLRAVVIGGGLIRAGSALLEPLAREAARYLTVHPVPRLVPAQLGSRAGMYGAAVLAWQAAGLLVPTAWTASRADSSASSAPEPEPRAPVPG